MPCSCIVCCACIVSNYIFRRALCLPAVAALIYSSFCPIACGCWLCEARPRCVQAKENQNVPPNVQRGLPGRGGPGYSDDTAAAKLAAADALRRNGNTLFKASKWKEASSEYTRSIDTLRALGAQAPPEQLALLLCNRAAARLMQVRP